MGRPLCSRRRGWREGLSAQLGRARWGLLGGASREDRWKRERRGGSGCKCSKMGSFLILTSPTPAFSSADQNSYSPYPLKAPFPSPQKEQKNGGGLFAPKGPRLRGKAVHSSVNPIFPFSGAGRPPGAFGLRSIIFSIFRYGTIDLRLWPRT